MTNEGIITWLISIILAVIVGLYSQEIKEWIHENLRRRNKRSKQKLLSELLDELQRSQMYQQNPSVIVVASWHILFRVLRYAVFGLMGIAMVAASPSNLFTNIGFATSMFSFLIMAARIQDGLDEHRLLKLSDGEITKLTNKVNRLQSEID